MNSPVYRLMRFVDSVSSHILQPQWKQCLRQWSPCAVWSFQNISKPTGARVSPAIVCPACLFCNVHKYFGAYSSA